MEKNNNIKKRINKNRNSKFYIFLELFLILSISMFAGLGYWFGFFYLTRNLFFCLILSLSFSSITGNYIFLKYLENKLLKIRLDKLEKNGTKP
jgi:hypothetical protein